MVDFEFLEDDAVEDRIEPGSPSLENVLFAILGALAMLAVVGHLVGIV